MIPQPLPTIGRKTDLPALPRRIGQSAPLKIIARRRATAGLELKAEKLRRLLHDIGKLGASVGLLLGLWVARGHRHPGLIRQDSHRFHEIDILVSRTKEIASPLA